ncbi:MAG: YceI family protein [Gemmatimonadetes bacterium]|nr:YceI family protein [Gemmatimonadota bacterium]
MPGISPRHTSARRWALPPAVALAVGGLMATQASAQDPPASEEQPAELGPQAMEFSDESLFAVVTHRGGLAGSLAHNHFVTADEYLANFAYDPVDPTRSTLRFSTLVEDLTIDDPELQAAWIDRIRTLDLVEEFGDLSEGDRAKVRREMLDEDQLDPDNFPLIAAVLQGISEQTSRVGEVDFTHVATVEVTIHGTTVTREVPVRYENEADGLRIEAVGRFQFEEFGIEPYSAFLGTVKVQNDFEIYLNLRADPA